MQGVNVFENGIGYLFKCLGLYMGGTGYFVMYLLALLVVLFKGDKKDRELFLPSAAVLLVTVYNPVVPIILDKIFDVNSEYYRLFWIAPVIVLVPYAATKLIFSAKSGEKKALTVTVIFAMMFFAGNFVYAKGINISQNIYRIDDELIEIDGIIHEDCRDEYAKAFFEYDYNMEIRQYDPKMLLTVDREEYIYAVNYSYTDQMLEDESHPENILLALLVRNQKVSSDSLRRALDTTDTQYVVLTKGHPQDRFIRRAGLYEIGETATHIVYRFDLSDPYPYELLDYSNVEHRFSYRRLK